ncbi:nuclear transport factor 2 family protein [Sphingomonas sp.]|uniref:nuclear transport factor 2 family protein n=1 Tax=Sphingomonas sp. TaxID=28214 RepID=UPI0025F89CD8|nr:nuclear transport factor 2 family protein [Sphingomonas sp.]
MKLASTLRTLAIGGTVCAAFLATPAWAGEDPKVAAEVIALTRAQWASDMAGQPAAQQMASVADDYTEFNADYPTRIDGKAMATRITEITPYEKTVFADMQNAKVQVYGDTAILTYNYAGITRGADGKTEPNLAKSTRVYVREGGHWMLVHANFAPVRGPDQ